MAGANIVDAQIYTTTDGRALDTISLSREFERDEDEERRAARIADSIEKALRGELRLPDVVAKRAPPKGRIKAFALEPSVTINNQWSHRYTMVEVTGLDRTGLLYDLTATLSKLNLNIASAHVATFGERVVDVFYVTDLLGAQITSPTRQAAIKRALIALFAIRESDGKAAKAAGLESHFSSSARRRRRMMTPRARSSAAASTASLMSRISSDISLCQSRLTTASGASRRRCAPSSGVGALVGQFIDVVEQRREHLGRRQRCARRCARARPASAASSPCTRNTPRSIGRRAAIQRASSGPSAWPE